MLATEAQIAAFRHPIDGAWSRFGPSPRASVLSDRQNAVAPSALNRGRAPASHSEYGGPGRQPGRHRRTPRVHVGRWPGQRCAAYRLSTMPARQTDAAVAQAAALVPGTGHHPMSESPPLPSALGPTGDPDEPNAPALLPAFASASDAPPDAGALCSEIGLGAPAMRDIAMARDGRASPDARAGLPDTIQALRHLRRPGCPGDGFEQSAMPGWSAQPKRGVAR